MRSPSQGFGGIGSRWLGWPGAGAVCVAAVALASACAHGAPGTGPAEPARLWIGGDVFLGTGGHGALAGLPAIVGGAPGVVNLEGPVGSGGVDAAGSLRLTHAPAALTELRAAGIAVAGIANNHMRDAGPGGGVATARALEAVGVRAAGGPAGPAIITLGGLRVVVTAHDLEAGVPAALRDELMAARRQGDVLVATFHVTGPPTYLPRPELVDAVAIALDAGAAVIAAHGTHELARVERRGRTVIAWGLGNLAFDCACTDEPTSAVLEVALDRRGAVEASVIAVEAGLLGGTAQVASDPAFTFELLEALGSPRLRRRGERAWF